MTKEEEDSYCRLFLGGTPKWDNSAFSDSDDGTVGRTRKSGEVGPGDS